MIEEFSYTDTFSKKSIFIKSFKQLYLRRLFDFDCCAEGRNETRGLAVLDTDEVRWEAGDFELLEGQCEEQAIHILWKVGNSGLEWQSDWNLDTEVGIWSRRDRLINRSQEATIVTRCLARFPFSPGKYKVYSQASCWAHESQGHWNGCLGGRLTFRSQAGRTCQGATPYVFVTKHGEERGIAFHILPTGNWVIHIDQSSNPGSELTPYVVVEMGLADDLLRLELSPGDSVDLPEILIQGVQCSSPEDGAAGLQRYAIDKILSRGPSVGQFYPPVVYNTWFDAFEFLDVKRLEEQLEAAKKVGCEVFTIDAGWYGTGSGLWQQQVGDWNEKLDGAFFGRMSEFAKMVRAAGLGFGLWIEPERYHPSTPVVKEHPNWFLPGNGHYLYPDLVKQEVYEYVLFTMLRMVETYQLAWMKVDFNMELGSPGDALHGYYLRWYSLLDDLRRRCPDTFFEGCASGGMRLDLHTLAHFDGHFLSDTVNPVDVLRITQGTALRVPPGRITKWAVIRGVGTKIPRYEHPLSEAPDRVLSTGRDGWEDARVYDLDFICRAALPGILGLSGDQTGLPEGVLLRLRHHVEIYKQWRHFLVNCICELLTPVEPLNDRAGWIAFQIINPEYAEISMLLAYRLEDGVAEHRFRLNRLNQNCIYQVENDDTPGEVELLSGKQLAETGYPVQLPSPNRAAFMIIQPVQG